MNVVDTKLLILEHYKAEDLLSDEAYLRKLRGQLQACEQRLAGVLEKYGAVRDIVSLGPNSSVNIAAALEWKDVKEEKARVTGKSIKLHKEISELENRISRRRSLRAWAEQ